MFRRIISGLVVALLLVNAVILAFNREPEFVSQASESSSVELTRAWDTLWGGLESDFCSAIATDGLDTYVTGNTWSFGAGDDDVFLLKLDGQGNIVWARTWGTSNREGGSDLWVGSDAVYVATNLGILKFGKAGNLIWSKTVAMSEGIDDIEVVGNNLYIGNWGGLFAKLSEVGNSLFVEWAEYLINEDSWFEPTLIRACGGSLYVAYKDSNAIAKFAADGVLEWAKYGGFSIKDFVVSSDGIIITCHHLVYKLSLSGDLLWAREFEPDATGNSVQLIGNYLCIAGEIGYFENGLVMVLTQSGDVVSSYSYGGNPYDSCESMVAANGRIYTAGNTWSSQRSLAPFACSLTPTTLQVEPLQLEVDDAEIYVESIQGVVASPAFQQAGQANVFVSSFSISQVPEPSYPTDRWERLWFVNDPSYVFTDFLGSGPDEVNQNFDTNWGGSVLAYGRGDHIGFISSRTVTGGGTWRFTVGSDDGCRLWVDYALVIDEWDWGTYRTYEYETTLSYGDHEIRFDYCENDGAARASFKMEVQPQFPSFPQDYWERLCFVVDSSYAFTDFLGVGLDETNLNFDTDWGGSALAYGRSDHIGFISSRTVTGGGTWKFTVGSDDGCRLYIEGYSPVIDEWHLGTYRTYTYETTLSPGEHKIEFDFFENDGAARASFKMEPLAPQPSYPRDRWERLWYVNSGNGVFGSFLGSGPDQPVLSFADNWGSGNVAYDQADFIGFKSSRTIHFSSGKWRFTITTDDGVRLRIDDELVLDKWFVQTPPFNTYSVDKTFMSAGDHLFLLEWYEETGNAQISLSFIRVPNAKVVYVTVKYSDSPEPESIDITKQRATMVSEYYMQQSYGLFDVSYDFVHDYWQSLGKTYQQYLTQYPDKEERWDTIRDDAISLSGVNEYGYDAIVVVQPKEMDYYYSYAEGKRVITIDTANCGVWAHELGHALPMLNWMDYYPRKGVDTGGSVGYWGLMGGGLSNPAAPIMSYNKVQANWLVYSQIGPEQYGEYGPINLLMDLKAGDAIYRYQTRAGSRFKYVILEGRSPPDGVLRDPNSRERGHLAPSKGVLLYGVEQKHLWEKEHVYVLKHIIENVVTLLPGETYKDPSFLASFSCSERNFQLFVKIDPYTPKNTVVLSLSNVEVVLPESSSGQMASLDTDSVFDVNLHAYTGDGSHVGLNYGSMLYEVGINGADASGNLLGGPEWISVPVGTEVSCTVDVNLNTQLIQPTAYTTDAYATFDLDMVYYDSTGMGWKAETLSDSINLSDATLSHSYLPVTTEEPNGTMVVYIIPIPEFPTLVLLPLFITVTLLLAVVCRKKRICPPPRFLDASRSRNR